MDYTLETTMQNPEETVNLEHVRIPWWAKLFVSAIAIILLLKFTPLLDAMYLFVVIVLLPLVALSFLGFGVGGAIDGFRWILAKIQDARKDQTPHPVAVPAQQNGRPR